MYMEIDLGTMPPAVHLREPDDFTKLHVRMLTTEHTFVEPEILAELSGRGEDAEWRAQLGNMLAYATSKGWSDGAGRARAHLEFVARDGVNGSSSA